MTNILENLPLFVFILGFFVIFFVFLFGGFVLLLAGKNIQKIERGRRILLNSLYSLFVILLMAFVFFSVTYLLKRGKVLRPSELPGEFPPSPASGFPLAPQFIEIGNYYFNGPWPLKDNNFIKSPAVFTTLCKKNGEYDIIYIGETGGGAQLLKHSQYQCWSKNCQGELKNLYLAIFWTSIKKYNVAQREAIKAGLGTQLNPPCPVEKI